MGKIRYLVYATMVVCIIHVIIFIFMIIWSSDKTSAIYMHIAIGYIGGWMVALISQFAIIFSNKHIELLRRGR